MYLKINKYKYVSREDLILVLSKEAIRQSKDNRDFIKKYGLDILDGEAYSYVLVQEEGEVKLYPSSYQVSYYKK
ncbi:MAG: hypothetical protein Q4E37_04390 [Tissierellia bacterium]|nr:hypothetical protein [Tissierellia bacterium]